jgi:hypothetical protein
MMKGLFPGFKKQDPYPWKWEFQQSFVKNLEKMHDLNFAVIKINAKNHCLGWHLQTFKHHNSEDAILELVI